jgi:hypothetical protein
MELQAFESDDEKAYLVDGILDVGWMLLVSSVEVFVARKLDN